MNSMISIRSLLIIFLLAITLAGLTGTPGLAQQGQAPPAAQSEENGETPQASAGEYQGALDIRLLPDDGSRYPSAEMVLTNPGGQTVGYEPGTSSPYLEIPQASYGLQGVADASGLNENVLYIRNPVSGTYNLRVIGTDKGRYSLMIKGYDASGSHADVSFRMAIGPRQVHHYLVNYSNREGAKVSARRTRITD